MLTTIDLTAAIAAAVRAPSLHNSQPWRFRTRGTAIEVRVDPHRVLPASDPSGWAARVACGAAVFNLRMVLAAQGWQPEVQLLPDPDDPMLVALVAPGRSRPPTPLERQLAAAVPLRRSNRAPFWSDPVPADARTQLVAAAREEHSWLELLIGLGPVNAVAEVAQAANQLLMRRPDYGAEVAAWTRHHSAMDGVPASVGGPSPQPEDLLPQRPYSRRPRVRGESFEPQPLVGVLGTVGDTPGDQLVAGQALQRVLLTATADGLSASLISQPIEVASTREQIRLALGRHGAPQMLIRLGYGLPGAFTRRRPPTEVMDV